MDIDLQFLNQIFIAASECTNLQSVIKDENDNETAAAVGNTSNPQPLNDCSSYFCSRRTAKKSIQVSVKFL